MNLFEDFINKRAGRFLWLLLLIVVVAINQNVIISWVLTAGMAWFAITYVGKSREISYGKLWKLSALFLPVLIYIAFLLDIECHDLKTHLGSIDSRKFRYIKMFVLLSTLLFIIISVAFTYELSNFLSINNAIITNYDKQALLNSKIERVRSQIFEGNEKNQYALIIQESDKRLKLLNNLIYDASRYKNNPVIKLLPYGYDLSRLSLERYYQFKVEQVAFSKWYRQALVDDSNYAKLNELLAEYEKESGKTELITSSLDKAYSKLQEGKKNRLAHFMPSVLLFLPLLILGIIVLTLNIAILLVSTKKKESFATILWSMSIALVLIAFVTTMYYFLQFIIVIG